MNSRMIEKTIIFLQLFDSVLDRDNDIITAVLFKFMLIILGFLLFPIWFTETLMPTNGKYFGIRKVKRE